MSDTSLRPLPPLPRSRRSSKSANNICACGCGGLTHARFVSGHDAKLHGWVLRVRRGETLTGLSDGQREAVAAEIARQDPATVTPHTVDQPTSHVAPLKPRILAIDWSGDLQDARRIIWVAEAGEGGQLTLLECGRDRGEIVEWLEEQAQKTPEMIVGLDFAFSFPAWFLTGRGFSDVRALWAAAASEGEDWLGECEPPFWGLPGHKRPDGVEGFRRG